MLCSELAGSCGAVLLWQNRTGRGLLTERAEKELLDRFVDAWHRADFDAIASLLQKDAVLAMPPDRLWFEGPSAIVGFLSTVPAGGRLDKIRVVPTRANRQLALAAFIADDEDQGHEFYGVMVFSFAKDGITTITGFGEATLNDYFGLSAWLPHDPASA